MKKIILFAAALGVTLSTPAMANTEAFDGVRGGALAGVSGSDTPFDDSEFSYGGVVGYDVAVNDTVLLGVEGDILASTNDDFGFDVDGRQLSVAGRVTYVTSPKVALFASGGYTNLRVSTLGAKDNFDGFRLGAGTEVNLSRNLYASAEYRFSQYDFEVFNDDIQSVLVGVGVRF